MTTTLVQSIAERQSATADKRIEALGLYRELLARRASPRDDDLDTLADLQERLGKSDADVRTNIALLDTEARIHRVIEQIQVLTKQSLAAQEKREAYRTKLDALEREQKATMDGLERDAHRLGSQIQHLRANQPERELRLLHGEHRELFGIEPPKPVEPPPKAVVPSHAETRIDEVRRRRERIAASGTIGPRQTPVGSDVTPPSTYVKPKPRVR